MARYARQKTKKGFTLIEVILFLAISSAILIAILSGTSRSLAQQRYNDSVQDLYSFIQSQYSSVINVENTNTPGGGRANTAIYGKLIVIGKTNTGDASTIDSYTIVGDAIFNSKIINGDIDISGFSTDDVLNRINLKITCSERNTYNFQWGAVIENKEPHGSINNKKTETTIAILRSPVNGTLFTYSADEALGNNCIGDGNGNGSFLVSGSAFTTQDPPTGMTPGPFSKIQKDDPLDLCIYTEDEAYGDRRRDIRISSANSVNSVQLIPLDDSGENKCK